MTSSWLQGLPFLSPVYNTYHVCGYVLWMEDHQMGASEASPPPLWYYVANNPCVSVSYSTLYRRAQARMASNVSVALMNLLQCFEENVEGL